MQQGNNKISLLISGNQFRSAGFQPIIATLVWIPRPITMC